MEISLTSIKNSLSALLHRYHFIIFIVTIIGGVTAFVFLLNTIVIKSEASSSDTKTTMSTSFDQKTIDEINLYKGRDTKSNGINFSGNKRTNPFQE